MIVPLLRNCRSGTIATITMSHTIIIKRFAILLLTLGSAVGAFSQGTYTFGDEPLYKEHYRNQYHFSVSRGWISDPCGFVFYEGKYHCYWWGCAESEDLVHFTEYNRHSQLNVPKGLGCWTGCVVVDTANTAGFGKGTYISCLTLNNDSLKNQSQAICVSGDHGRTFEYYSGNPVLDIGYQDFRDPTVIWHEESQQWIMVVSKTLESKVAFYSSKDLKHWDWLSDFGPAGRTYRCFECPDIFRLPIEGTGEIVNGKLVNCKYKWVLVVSVDWDNEQYFVGDFDGKEFHAEGLVPETGLYVDRAPDFYASRTVKDFDGTLGGEVYSMGWMSNWAYCRLLPQTYGKGFWSVPRRLSLRHMPDGYRLSQQPIKALQSLRGDVMNFRGKLRTGVTPLHAISSLKNTYEMDVTFDCSRSNTFGMNFFVGCGRKLTLTYSTDSHSLTVDRTQVAEFRMEKFERTCHGKVAPIDGKLRLRIFVDKNSIEIFSEDGLNVFSLQTFAADEQTGFELFSLQSPTPYTMSVWPLASIWP